MKSLLIDDRQRAVQETARKFAENEVAQIAREVDEEERWPRKVWEKAVETGLVGVEIPTEYGGAGMGTLEAALVSEEIARVDAGVRAALITDFGTRMITNYGNKTQKEKILRGVANGNLIGAMANTEPSHGSDAANIETRAKKDGDKYVINGVKTFISQASVADYVLTMCRTSDEGRDGISAFIVETDQEGFEIKTTFKKMGWNASPTAQIRYNDVRVPAENLVGTEGEGFYQLMEFFEEERVLIGAQALGIAKGCLGEAIDYAKDREQFGQSISEFQAIKHKLADMALKV